MPGARQNAKGLEHKSKSRIVFKRNIVSTFYCLSKRRKCKNATAADAEAVKKKV